MKIHHVLICCFLLCLQITSIMVDESPVPLYVRGEGEDVTFTCPSASASDGKFFFKEECEQENIIFQTFEGSAQSGRFSLVWTSSQSSSGELSVKISGLKKSDSGAYRCGAGRTITSARFQQMEVLIADAMLGRRHSKRSISTTAGAGILVECYLESYPQISADSGFFCSTTTCRNIPLISSDFSVKVGRYTFRYKDIIRAKCLYVGISKITVEDAGWYICGVNKNGRRTRAGEFQIIVEEDPITVFNQPDTTTVSFTVETTSIPSSTTTASTESLSPEKGSPSPSSKVPRVPLQAEPSTTEGRLVYVVVVLLIAVIVLGLILTAVCIHANASAQDLNVGVNRKETNMEFQEVSSESRGPCQREESIYESLNPSDQDQEQTYSTLGLSHKTDTALRLTT